MSDFPAASYDRWKTTPPDSPEECNQCDDTGWVCCGQPAESQTNPGALLCCGGMVACPRCCHSESKK